MSQVKVTLGTEGQAARSLCQPWLSHKGDKTQKLSAGLSQPEPPVSRPSPSALDPET